MGHSLNLNQKHFPLSSPCTPNGVWGHNNVPPLGLIPRNYLRLTSYQSCLFQFVSTVFFRVVLGHLHFLLPVGIHYSASLGDQSCGICRSIFGLCSSSDWQNTKKILQFYKYKLQLSNNSVNIGLELHYLLLKNLNQSIFYYFKIRESRLSVFQ